MRIKKLFLIFLFVGFIACDDIIEVVDISNETVTIIAPVNGSVIDTTRVNFTWKAMEEAETYHLQVATPTFNEATQIVLDTVVTKTEVSKTLNNNNYEWRIKAKNSGYETVYTTQSFSVTD